MWTKRRFQPPFRQQDLLRVSEFIEFCGQRGIRTDENELEYLEKEGLLLPAVRVNPGHLKRKRVLVRTRRGLQWQFWPEQDIPALKYKRIDRRAYYAYAPVLKSTDNWLSEYEKRGMVLYPPKCRFRKWKYYRGRVVKRHEYWATVPPKRYEVFYSQFQIFPLKRVKQALTIRISGRLLLGGDKTWLRFGRETRSVFANVPGALRRIVLQYYETIQLLQDILDLQDEVVRAIEAEYNDSLTGYRKDSYTNKEAEQAALEDARDEAIVQEKDVIPRRTRAILKKSELTIREVEARRRDFVNLSLSVDPIGSLLPYMERIPADYLERCRGDYKFARDCHRVVDQLGWFLEKLGQRVPSLQKMMIGREKFKICPYCEEYFEPKRRNQVTCGKKACKRKHENVLKRELRRITGKT